MTQKEAKDRIAQLDRELLEHNRNYYVLNAPVISDFEYDILMQELMELQKRYPQFVNPSSPALHPGSEYTPDTAISTEDAGESTNPNVIAAEPARKFNQLPHKNPMLSLGNTYDFEEVRAFDARIREAAGVPFTYNCELKFDGTAICLTYIDGKLVHALTRGDGMVGDDVTENVKRIPSIPQQLKPGYPHEFEIRGEIFMPFEAFDRLNMQKEMDEEPLFANPRNAAAGSLKLLNSEEVAQRGLDCILYHIISPESNFTTHTQALERASEWGLPVSSKARECTTVEEIEEFINYWDSERKMLPYATDGIVIKVNNLELQRQLGFTAKSPKWATAYKFKPEEALTPILSIDFQVGRTGAITPVANLSPVQLSGTVVKRATLHNRDQMEVLDIHTGDWVYVEKGGEIIPKITRVELSKRAINATRAPFPSICPDCGTPLVSIPGQAGVFCPNSDGCPMQRKGKFIHFVGRKAMNINIGEATIEQLYNKGYISEIEDLYSLSREQLLSLDKFKEKSASNLMASLQQSLSVPYSRVLFALGIKNIGEQSAKTLAHCFNSIDELAMATKEELMEVEDVGEIMADSIIDFFASDIHRGTIEALRAKGVQLWAGSEVEKVSNALEGRIIMITGTYSVSREEMKAYIESHGGKVASSVTAKTTWLLAGEKPGDSKIKKATQLNIPIIDEAFLYNITSDTEKAEGINSSTLF